ncbi:hypothetical protein P167DRAFT_563376 [Morchella conica CCBAS932]|uniref:Uncharacterized protein n=1 Tax=Morchella conica CCBAS932 TaxID=1392247 RepID=A0A3N4L0L0_9PEZI|nr:hypothetical protein P167DRAFT_563376 [Morchella conica CCBAS932]
MARTPTTSTASSSSMSETQAAASTALAALLARRRGVKVKPSAGVRKARKPKAKKEVLEMEKSKIVAKNVTVLKGAGKVSEKERGVRMRILGMREEKSGKKKGGKKVVVEDSDSD